MNRVTTTALAALKTGHDNGERVIDGGGRGEGALLLRVTDTGRLFYLRYFHAGKRKLELALCGNSTTAKSPITTTT